MKIKTCISTVGIDDFAFKKRHNYGTIIVDEKNHKPISILDDMDGKTLSSWLKENKHIKMVTRDRTSAYAKVIEQELLNAMQIADRFHIHPNLLHAIKKALYKEIPSTVKIENNIKTQSNSEHNEPDKKILKTVVNFTVAEQIRVKLIYKIQMIYVNSL